MDTQRVEKKHTLDLLTVGAAHGKISYMELKEKKFPEKTKCVYQMSRA